MAKRQRCAHLAARLAPLFEPTQRPFWQSLDNVLKARGVLLLHALHGAPRAQLQRLVLRLCLLRGLRVKVDV